MQRDPDLFKDILKETNDYNRKNHIKGFEIVKNVHLCKEHFSIDNNLLTTTMKIKRYIAKSIFQKNQKNYTHPNIKLLVAGYLAF